MTIFHSNSSCPLPKDAADLRLTGEPIVGPLTFQHLILIISVACTGVAASASLWLIVKHLHRYTAPKEQRQIIRIIFTPVVFSLFSAFSILDYSAAIYLTPIRDLYEVFALAALFLLFTEYVAPEPQTRDAFFAALENRKPKRFAFGKKNDKPKFTVIPGGSLRWFHNRWVAVFGYVFVSVITTIAQEISQATDTYCSTSFSPRFANIYILIIENVAVTIAINSVITYYGRLRGQAEFDVHKPLLKLLSFKLIVFTNFLQDLVFGVLTSRDMWHGTHRITGKDLAIGVPAVVVAVEQVAFAIFFHYSFRSREYHESSMAKAGPAQRMSTLRAAAHAFNPSDLIYGVAHAFTLLAFGVGPVSRNNSNKGYNTTQSPYQLPAAQGLEPMRDSYPPPYGQGMAAHGLYRPQGRYQNPAALLSAYDENSVSQDLSRGREMQDQTTATQSLGVGGDMLRYDRSRSRSAEPRHLAMYQSPSSPFDSERERLTAGAAVGYVRSHSTDGGAEDAASMRSMV